LSGESFFLDVGGAVGERKKGCDCKNSRVVFLSPQDSPSHQQQTVCLRWLDRNGRRHQQPQSGVLAHAGSGQREFAS